MFDGLNGKHISGSLSRADFSAFQLFQLLSYFYFFFGANAIEIHTFLEKFGKLTASHRLNL